MLQLIEYMFLRHFKQMKVIRKAQNISLRRCKNSSTLYPYFSVGDLIREIVRNFVVPSIILVLFFLKLAQRKSVHKS